MYHHAEAWIYAHKNTRGGPAAKRRRTDSGDEVRSFTELSNVDPDWPNCSVLRNWTWKTCTTINHLQAFCWTCKTGSAISTAERRARPTAGMQVQCVIITCMSFVALTGGIIQRVDFREALRQARSSTQGWSANLSQVCALDAAFAVGSLIMICDNSSESIRKLGMGRWLA